MKLKAIGTALMFAGAVCMLGANDANGGCSDDYSTAKSDQMQNSGQEDLSRRAVEAVGLPAITQFTEKRIYKDIYELRDQSGPTITYIVDLNGKLHKLCDSMGYGFPYATQYTNPMRIGGYHGDTAYPQADPNGLFSPADAEGTWVMCLDPSGTIKIQDKQVMPLYIEPRIVVSPFTLPSVP